MTNFWIAPDNLNLLRWNLFGKNTLCEILKYSCRFAAACVYSAIEFANRRVTDDKEIQFQRSHIILRHFIDHIYLWWNFAQFPVILISSSSFSYCGKAAQILYKLTSIWTKNPFQSAVSRYLNLSPVGLADVTSLRGKRFATKIRERAGSTGGGCICCSARHNGAFYRRGSSSVSHARRKAVTIAI